MRKFFCLYLLVFVYAPSSAVRNCTISFNVQNLTGRNLVAKLADCDTVDLRDSGKETGSISTPKVPLSPGT